MNQNRWSLIILFVISGFLFFNSCSKNETSVENNTKLNKVYSLTDSTINTFLTLAGQDSLINYIKYPVDIYTYEFPMMYRNQEIEASGLICVPVSTGGNFPVLSFQHGTIVAKNEAPTLSYSTVQNFTLAGLAGAGYILIIPDLVGFGASSTYFHPFLVKESNVNAVEAMLKALQNISPGELSGSTPNDSLFLAGYSQGGWLTLAVLQDLEKNNNTNWNIIATACGAGPYRPSMVLDYVLSNDKYYKPFYLPYALLSFIEDGTIYGNMNKYFNEPYASKIPDLFDGINTGSQIDAELTFTTHDLLTPEMFNYKTDTNFNEMVNSFDKNSVNAWKTDAHILLLHGENDIYVPKMESDTIYQDFINIGARNVNYISIPQTDHITAAGPSIGLALNWFQSFRNVELIAKR